MEKMYGNYGRMLYMGTDGKAYFSMRISKSAIPYESEYNTFMCSGFVPEYNQGYPLTLYGEWNKSSDNKWKFIVSSFEEDLKSGRILVQFLMDNLDGVGEKTAEKIATIGESLWELIKSENAATEICKRTHLSEKISQMVVSLLRKKESRYEVYCFLCQYGITDVKVDKLISEYGDRALTLIKRNPYQTLIPHDIPFQVADEIAFCEGISYYYPPRLEALFQEAMRQCVYQGSTYTNFLKFLQKVQKIAKDSLFGIEIPDGFLALTFQKSKYIFVDQNTDRIYFRKIWEAEQNIVRNIRRLNQTKREIGYKESEISEVEKSLGITYESAQREAFHILNDSGVKILTGGPGTGKTTLLNGLLKIYQKHRPNANIVLCSPTGMASERMAESTGHEAATVHKTLEYRPFDGENAMYKNQYDPIAADFIVVDESSMIDTELTGMLLDAVPSGCLVLFCGDVDQLDSVGAGAVLKDMIASGIIPVYRLDTLFRQNKESTIVPNATKIKNSETDLTLAKDFRVFRYQKNTEVKNLLDKLFKSYNLNTFTKTQILSTTKKSESGTYAINNYIQQKIPFPKKRTIHRNGFIFHAGDKIMTLRNNYEAGYFNGDIGEIMDITDMGQMTIRLKHKVILMQNAWLEEIMPAYAVTVHKSQGSEFDNVVIIIPQNPSSLLDRSLIYTAVTRAKKNVFILSQNDALEQAIRKDRKQTKETSLADKLKSM